MILNAGCNSDDLHALLAARDTDMEQAAEGKKRYIFV